MPEVFPVLLVVTAVIAWLNARFLKLPSTIGVMTARETRRPAAGRLASADLGRLAWRHFGGASLSLPAGPERGAVVTITYIVVVFSVLVQGLSMERLVRKVVPCARAQDADEGSSP